MTPLTETQDTVIIDMLASSGPSAEITDPTIGEQGSRELYDSFFDDEEE